MCKNLPLLLLQVNLSLRIIIYLIKVTLILIKNKGIYGKDWLGVAAIMNLIQELVLNFDDNYNYTNKCTWVVVPVLNPDGYNETISNPEVSFYHVGCKCKSRSYSYQKGHKVYSAVPWS